MITKVARSRLVGGETASVTVGPLAGYETALRAYLADAGYAAGHASDVVAAMARLSEWMDATRVSVGDLTPLAVAGFVAARRKRVSEIMARRGVSVVVALRREVGAMPQV